MNKTQLTDAISERANISKTQAHDALDAITQGIEQAIEELDVDWFELCQKVKEKKFADDVPQDAKEKAKIIRYLQYRGHAMNVIMEALRP